MFAFNGALARLGMRRLFVAVLFVFFVYISVSWWQTEQDAMKISFLDIGQGDAVLVTTPSGVRMLYDAGPKDGPILARLGEELPFGVDTIDVCIPSHPDADHIGGFANVLKHYHCRLWLDGHTNDKSGVFSEMEQLVNGRVDKRATVERGSRIQLGGGVVADVIDPSGSEQSAWRNVDTNERSVVLRVSYASTSVFLSGDLPIDSEEELARGYGAALKSDIFKAGHHGSKTSNSSLLLSQVKPSLVAVSYGAHNRYGHPHKEAMDRLRATGADVYETAKVGTIRFVCGLERCALDN